MEPILITGGTGGLGQAVVKRLVGEYTVIVTYRAASEWDALRAAMGDDERLHGFAADVTDAAALEAVLDETKTRCGPLYGLVHLAGGFAGGSVEATTPEEWRRLLEANLTSTFVAAHTALPQLRERGEGRVIAVSSAAALPLPAGLAAYNISKLGVANLIEALAKELKGTRITANVLVPGSMATPAMLQSEGADKLVPLEHVADTIAWLLSAAGAGVTGGRIPLTVTGAP